MRRSLMLVGLIVLVLGTILFSPRKTPAAGVCVYDGVCRSICTITTTEGQTRVYIIPLRQCP